jgi:DNA-binding Lrp family transcriptional regulator
VEPAARLDETDRKLLETLQRNGRISNKELAASASIAPSTCLDRVRRLHRLGVIRGYHAEVDPVRLGYSTQALISIRLSAHARHFIDDLHRHLLSMPESLTVFHVTGADDYIVHVAVTDPEHLRILVLDKLTARPEVEHVETRLIFQVANARISVDASRPPAKPPKG